MNLASRYRMSLRLRLMTVIGLSLLLLWSCISAWMFIGVRHQVREALDERLASSARMVAGLMSALPNGFLVGEKQDSLDVIGRDGLACEVSLLRGEVGMRSLAKTAGSPRLDQLPVGYGTHTFGGKPWRTFVLEQNGMRIATADRIDGRESLLRGIALVAAVPFLVAFAGTLLALWFGVDWGLAPVERLRKLLERRRPEDTEPLPSDQCPIELLPLTGTIDRLVSRVREALLLERRFTDAAAHELRTPLAAIKLHLQIAEMAQGQQGAAGSLVEALGKASQGTQRMQHLLDQLLQLARVDGDAQAHQIIAPQLAVVAMERVLSPASRIRLRTHFNSFRNGESVTVRIPELLLSTVLRNLVENALNYSPPESLVDLHLDTYPDRIELRVLDRGCGMSLQEHRQAVQRFWRRSQAVSGSGLGLAIVTGILDKYDGQLVFEEREGGGTSAAVHLKRYKAV